MRISIKTLFYTLAVVTFLASSTGCGHKKTKEIQEIRPAEFPRLAAVKHIYIDHLGRGEGSDLLREKFYIRLLKSSRFKVVDVRSKADAILTGVGGYEKSYKSNQGQLKTHYAGVGVFRIVNAKSNETIWIYEYRRGFSMGSATSRVAKQTIKMLHKQAKNADRDAAALLEHDVYKKNK